MTIEAMKAVVNEVGGPEKIVGFRQANGCKHIFSRFVFKLEDLVELGGQEFIKLRYMDTLGHECIGYLVMDEIVHLYTIDDVEAGIIVRDVLN